MIVSRELPTGSRLVLRRLAKRLGVSVTPVVGAIQRLERDGLVVMVPELGAFVKQWTRGEILEAYYIRRALEKEAARLFVERASPEDKRKLIELNDLFDGCASKDQLKCDEADINLHLHIVRSTGLPRLYELTENSKIETTLLHGLTMSRSESPEEVALSFQSNLGCHKPLIEVLLGDDPEAAEREMARHIDNILKVILGIKEEPNSPSIQVVLEVP